jgi:hypothetical protein
MFRIQKRSLNFDVSTHGDEVYVTLSPITKGEQSTIEQIIRNETLQAGMYLRYFCDEQSEENLMGYFTRKGYTVTKLLPIPTENELGDISLVYAFPLS